MPVSQAAQGIPTGLISIIQDNTLERVFHDALFPRLLFRAEAVPELWAANLGEVMLMTRTGLMLVDTTPLVPGQDPQPRSFTTEQWRAQADQHGNSLDTHMPSSYVALASKYLRDTQQLGLNAGQTLNRLARNNLFLSYLEGEALTTATVAGGLVTIPVTTIAGFTEQLLNGTLSPVSAANPIPVTFSGTEPANTVIAAAPDDPAIPFGSGTLTLGAVLTVGLALREGIFAATRSRRLRVGAGATVDAITAASVLTLDDCIAAATRLRDQNVPPHADGKYHAHITPQGEQELFADNHWQRLYQSLPDSVAYRDLAIGTAVGINFYRNTENPNVDTVNAAQLQADPGPTGGALLAPEIGAEVTNDAGIPIRRVLVTGGGVLYEKYLDESKYITEAGVQGKIGNFSIVNGGAQVMANRIRYILRSPQDRLQQIVSQSWSWSGDFPVPSDQTAGDGARFKRATVIEHS